MLYPMPDTIAVSIVREEKISTHADQDASQTYTYHHV
jgi:hypothetical protein